MFHLRSRFLHINNVLEVGREVEKDKTVRGRGRMSSRGSGRRFWDYFSLFPGRKGPSVNNYTLVNISKNMCTIFVLENHRTR
jgi:hypothetical protein